MESDKIQQIRQWQKDLGINYDFSFDEIDDYYNHLYKEIYGNGPFYICDF